MVLHVQMQQHLALLLIALLVQQHFAQNVDMDFILQAMELVSEALPTVQQV